MKNKSSLKKYTGIPGIPLKTNELIMNQYHFAKSILTGYYIFFEKKWFIRPPENDEINRKNTKIIIYKNFFKIISAKNPVQIQIKSNIETILNIFRKKSQTWTLKYIFFLYFQVKLDFNFPVNNRLVK